ncbi:MAG TPA: TM0106 family RecB-like putative nuclease [Candidatus Baltobacteraceae bacterium]|nr:TM0106 family RecB-like putative nuclease [Candidatus Baltobacteraceae bacterium]
MQRIDGRFVFSASDLNNALECDHLIELEALAARGELQRPQPGQTAALLARKGDEHERRQLARYRERYGEGIVGFTPENGRTLASFAAAEQRTLAAMELGAPFIYQATFFDGEFLGRTDFLRRVERACVRWPWSYEVIDAKLALVPRPYYLVQLAHYSAHLARVQGTSPQQMHVVLGSGVERPFRVEDFAAYERHLRTRFVARMAQGVPPAYPLEVGHCEICRWYDRCAAQRQHDDHLSLVARIRHDQIARLEENGIATMSALAGPSARRPFGMDEGTFATLHSQAALQVAGRRDGSYVYELLDAPEGAGFELLPRPDDGDLFFDMEGDPLYALERGLEYLFGFHCADEQRYVSFWARTQAQERSAFEAAIDFIRERRARHPGMHVYHYAPYETTALRRLMGFYGTRERELDDLLRGQTFVDLFTVVRQTLRISQPSYSIKKLEPFYGMRRTTGVQRGDDSIVMFETWLAGGDNAILDDIERYNADDCRSTLLLRDWLLRLRAQYQTERGRALAWREVEPSQAPEDDGRSELAAQLLDGLEAPSSLTDLRARDERTRARWLLGHLLEYHAREAKPAYWKYYDRIENADRLVEFDHEALGGLKLRADVPPYKEKRSYVYTYTFPDQLHNLGTDKPYCPHARAGAGTIVSLDDDRNELRIKLSSSICPQELRALIPGMPVQTNEQRKALARIAQAYLDGSLTQSHPATLSLLLARAPRLRTPRATIQPDEIDVRSVGALIADLDGSHVAIQGPPGSGKSTLAAAVIADLLAAGKRIGIVAGGHKAIHNVLEKIESHTAKLGLRFRGIQKYSTTTEGSEYRSSDGASWIATTTSNESFAADHDLAAGTAWLFTRPEMAARYDYLFIDEAGQMSLGDALACSAAARNVVLLGDPLQLAAVSQGSHPPGTDLSILAHLLGPHETIDPREGIFLDRSYRMAPEICSFISHAVYEDRLHAAPVCARNAIDAPLWRGSGLRYIPVEHDGNTRVSEEEARVVTDTALALLRGVVTIGEKAPRPVCSADLIIVSPYNAQRKRIRHRLEEAGLGEIRVGTVDKFQGQEAAVVLYSMATSNEATLPRDLEFLFERNRLNVAISRAQCLSILVCSPALLSVRCSTPEQMELVNLLCAFVERAAPASGQLACNPV